MKKPLSRSIHKKHSAPAPNLEQIVTDTLTFLAADHERLDRFFALTGLSGDTLRAAVRNPAFAESLLDYLASDERLLLAFCAEQGEDPARFEVIRLALGPPRDGF